MIAVNVDSKTTTIPLGRQGENLARVIYFDLSEMIEEYGEGTATLMNKRVGDSVAYKCTTTQSGDLLTWMPTNTDTAYSGTGKCELRWVVGNVLAKSVTYKTTITPSITAETDIPASYQTWYESLLAEISEYTIASADIAKNKSDIATCKTNVATNTAAITALNSRIAQQYKGTGTYASLDPLRPNDEKYLGGIIDYVVDTYLQSQDTNSTNTYTIEHGGPMFSITLAKKNNNYFCGTAMSYHAATQSTVWYFENFNGQKCLRPLTPITI
jgi:hypothetical protein